MNRWRVEETVELVGLGVKYMGSEWVPGIRQSMARATKTLQPILLLSVVCSWSLYVSVPTPATLESWPRPRTTVSLLSLLLDTLLVVASGVTNHHFNVHSSGVLFVVLPSRWLVVSPVEPVVPPTVDYKV